jgi:hypothetical protein
LKELQQAGRQGGLSGIEIIEGAVLADEEWTPQNVSYTHYILIRLLMKAGFGYLSTEAQSKRHSEEVPEGS